MILYVDASSIVALHLNERERHPILIELKERSDSIITSRVSYAQARAAFARIRRDPDRRPVMTQSRYDAAVQALDSDWSTYIRVAVSEDLVQEAGRLTGEHPLKGFDAIQLASALTVLQTLSDEFRFSTGDRSLSRAAQEAPPSVVARTPLSPAAYPVWVFPGKWTA